MLRTRSWLTSIFVLAITCAPACGGGSDGGGGGGTGGGSSCALAPEHSVERERSAISPRSDATHDLVAVKDPTVVQFNGRWHVFASSVSTQGAYNMVYSSFSDWSEASTAPLYYMDQTSGFNTYVAAPELFYFRPQQKWYLVFQSGPPMYSSAERSRRPHCLGGAEAVLCRDAADGRAVRRQLARLLGDLRRRQLSPVLLR